MPFRRGIVLLGVCFVGCLSACALDRITLRNGFSYDCDHRQAVDSAHTRLFLTPGSDGSYVDVMNGEIAAIEQLPDPPRSTGVKAAAAASPVDTRVLLETAGVAHDIDVELLASLVHAESAGRAHAMSHAGAQGLMQLMPSTARAMGVADSFAPDQNVKGGTTYLDWLLMRYRNNLALALAAYNAGPGAVDRFHGIPPYRETRAYVVRVMTEFKQRKQALQHQGTAPVVQAQR